MQGTWSSKCLEAQGKRVTDHADTVDSIVPGRWVESLLCIADEEHKTRLAPGPAEHPERCRVHKYAFCVLASYDRLLALQPRWGILIARRRTPRTSEQKDGLGALRALLPEFLAGIKNVPGTKTSGNIAVKDMDCLPSVDGAANSKLGDGNEQLILKHSVCTWPSPLLFFVLVLVSSPSCAPGAAGPTDERLAASVPRRSAWSVHTSTTRTFAPLLQMLTDDAGTGGEGEAHKIP
ncbi:hypothetical protein B0H14DRAFT_3496318 [Mycena olivaceomarginata]|nr:hypothetical protein B0H14DRAFT_3496318 [Mycena olivaceomarginata]